MHVAFALTRLTAQHHEHPRETDRHVGRLAAQHAVTRLLGLDRRMPVALRHTRHGAPRASVRRLPTRRRLRVSIAHRDGWGAALAAWNCRVGVDLERADAVRRSHVRYFLSSTERCALAHYTRTELWALKEASWKLLELNRAVPFTALRLLIDDRGAVTALAIANAIVAVRAAVRRIAGAYILAVVTAPRMHP